MVLNFSTLIQIKKKENFFLEIKGPLGTINYKISSFELYKNITINNSSIQFNNINDLNLLKVIKSELQNIFQGVCFGFFKKLELKGVGFRFNSSNNNKTLTMKIGFSDIVLYNLPDSINLCLIDNTNILLYSIDYFLINQVCGDIILLKKPDKYKGKGIYINDF